MQINTTKMNAVKYLALSFILFLGIGTLKAQDDKKVIDQVLAVVGKQVILMSDIENQALQMRAQGYYTSGDLKCEVFEEMLYAKLLVNQSYIDSVSVGEPEVEGEMDRRLDAYINQIGSVEKLEEFYNKPLDEIKEELYDVIKDQMLSQRMMQEVTADIKVTPQEVKSYYKNLPKDSLPIVNTEFEIEQIIVHPKIEEIEILRIKDQLRDFKARVSKGESLATLAVLYSEDPGTAARGGELGFFGRGDMVSEFSAVAFNLDEGEVSKVVKTDYGFHVIQLIEKRGERINCRHILLKPRINPLEKQNAIVKLDSVRTMVNNDDLTFKEACWRFSEDEDTRLNGGVMVNPMSGNSRWEASQLDSKVAFGIKGLKEGEISKPFEGEDANGNPVYRIVLLKTKSKPHPANLTDDYQRIQDLATSMKKAEFMDEWVDETVANTYLRIDSDYENCDFSNKAWDK